MFGNEALHGLKDRVMQSAWGRQCSVDKCKVSKRSPKWYWALLKGIQVLSQPLRAAFASTLFELRVRLARGFTKQQGEACGFEVQEMYLALAAAQRAARSCNVKIVDRGPGLCLNSPIKRRIQPNLDVASAGNY